MQSQQLFKLLSVAGLLTGVGGWRVQAPRMALEQQSRAERLRSMTAGAFALVGSTVLPRWAAAAGKGEDLTGIRVSKEGKEYTLGQVLGKKATLVVNVASQCALTGGSYKGLVTLYDTFKDQGLEILAFPSNQFGQQEPDPEEKIRVDMKRRFGVTFPIYDKINVNGEDAHPLYKAIKSYEPELSGYPPKIAWNFEKFLLNAVGVPVRRYRPGVDPESIIPEVEKLLVTGSLPTARKRSLNEY